MGITLLPWIQQTCSTGMHGVEGGEPYYMAIDYKDRKPDLQKVERPERNGKIITEDTKIEFLMFAISVYYN